MFLFFQSWRHRCPFLYPSFSDKSWLNDSLMSPDQSHQCFPSHSHCERKFNHKCKRSCSDYLAISLNNFTLRIWRQLVKYFGLSSFFLRTVRVTQDLRRTNMTNSTHFGQHIKTEKHGRHTVLTINREYLRILHLFTTPTGLSIKRAVFS